MSLNMQMKYVKYENVIPNMQQICGYNEKICLWYYKLLLVGYLCLKLFYYFTCLHIVYIPTLLTNRYTAQSIVRKYILTE